MLFLCNFDRIIRIWFVNPCVQAFFVKYRLCIVEIVKHVSASAPQLPLQIVDEWLRCALQRPAPLLDLEAVSSLVDAVYGRIVTAEQLGPVYPQTAELMKLCLEYKNDDPRVLSEVLAGL